MEVFARVDYKAVVIPKRGSKERTLDVYEIVRMNLAEVDPEDAPMATRWRLEGGGPEAFDGFDHTRWHEGSHWRPLYNSDAAPITMEELVANAPEGRVCNPKETRTGNFPVEVKEEAIRGPLNPVDYKVIMSNTRDKFLENMRSTFDNRASIDGLIYCRTGQPYYHLPLGGWHSTTEMQFQVRFVSPVSEHDAPHECFSPNDHEKMSDFFRAYCGAPEEVETFEDLAIEVLIPDSVNFDREGECLCRMTSDLLGRDTGSMQTWTDERIDAWKALRQSFNSCFGAGYNVFDPVDADRLCDHLRVYADISECKKVSAMAISAADRWQSNPLEIELTPFSGLRA